MNNFKIFLISIFLLSLCASCKKITNNGETTTEERELSNFKSIASEISGDVFITQDSNYAVSVTAKGNILDILKTTIDEDKVLHIYLKNGKFVSSKNIQIYITMPEIKALSLYGSGNIEMMNTLYADLLDITTKGSGGIKLQEANADEINVKISGSGSVNSISGTVKKEKITISGSGSVDFYNLKALNSTIKISGSGDAQVYATDSLSVKISGSGNVYYKGNPIIDADISGSGKLKQL